MPILMAVVIMALVLVARQLQTQCRINEEHEVVIRELVGHINLLQEDEYWHNRVSMVMLRNEMRDMILLQRSRGDLDGANRIMEIWNYFEHNVDASWSEDLLRGFP